MKIGIRKQYLLPLILVVSAVGLAYLTCQFKSAALFFIALAVLGACVSITFKTLRSVSVVFIALALSLALAECIGGYFINNDIKAEYDFNVKKTNGYWSPKTDLGTLANVGTHTSRKIMPDGKVIYDVIYTIGDDGFRQSHVIAQPQKRMNFFGCSFMFGEGLNDNETLPFFVGQKMPNTFIKNYGFHGFGAHQALAILQGSRDTTGDINFYLTAPFHIPRSACQPAYTAGSPQFVIRHNKVVRAGSCEAGEPSDAISGFFKYSNLYKLTEKVLSEKVSDDDIALYLAIVKEMSDISKARHQKFIVGYIKSNETFFEGTHYSNEKLYNALAQMSDAIIDVSLTQGGEELDEKYYIHPLDKHPSGLANKTRAEIISDVLIKN